MDAEARSGENRGGFPATRWSAIVAARSADAAERTRALDVLLAAYWKPIYKYIRLRWSKPPEDAQDLTQDFFSRMLEKRLLDGYDPARARLRTFLRACVDSLVANQERAERRQKRGGGVLHLPLDFEAADGELRHAEPVVPAEMEAFFEKEWARSVFSVGVERLRAELAAREKSVYFRIFERYDLLDALPDGPDRRPTYQELARELDLSPTDVTNFLAYARREFRRIVLDFLRQTTASEKEFLCEARSLLGADPALSGRERG
jgi:DNA-directed RNA polymerase specialized sigma24 family protein